MTTLALLFAIALGVADLQPVHLCDQPREEFSPMVGEEFSIFFCAPPALDRDLQYRITIDDVAVPSPGPLMYGVERTTSGLVWYATPRTLTVATPGRHVIRVAYLAVDGTTGEYTLPHAFTAKPAPVVPTPFQASPDGTRIPPALTLNDGYAVWSMFSGAAGVVLRDGVSPFGSWMGTGLSWCGGKVRMLAGDLNWYEWAGGAWTAPTSADPCVSVAVPPVVPPVIVPPVVPPVDPPVNACAAPFGVEAAAVYVTRWTQTTRVAGSRMRVDYQLASKSPIVEIQARVDGAAVQTVTGTDLTGSAGLWFLQPGQGAHKLTVLVRNAFGCTREAYAPVDLVIK